MKLLHVTDLHFHKLHCDWLSSACSQADLVCLSGDFLDSSYAQSISIDDQINWLRQWLTDLSVPTLVCSGNHDYAENELNTNWLSDLPNVFGDHTIKEFGGFKFGSIAFGEEELERFNECDVLLHHEPPARLKVAKHNSNDLGSRDLFLALKNNSLKPIWILCGHVHQPLAYVSRFRNTRISNPGVNRNHPQPNHHWITL